MTLNTVLGSRVSFGKVSGNHEKLLKTSYNSLEYVAHHELLRAKIRCSNRSTESVKNWVMLGICDVLMLVTVHPQKQVIMKQVIHTAYLCFAMKLHPLNLVV